MKELLFVVVGMLVFGSVGVGSVGDDAVGGVERVVLEFFQPCVVEDEGFVTVAVEGANAYHFHPGEPVLPVFVSTLSFPFGTRIVDVECRVGEVKSRGLSVVISPAPQPVVVGSQVKAPVVECDRVIYSSDGLFPDVWCSYSTGGGLDEQNVYRTFCTLKVYPVRYNPVRNSISFVDRVEVCISVDEPVGDPFPEVSEYELDEK